MLSVETSAKATALEQVMLWIVVGLFVVLSISWAVSPRVYERNHPTPQWPGEIDSFGPSNAELSLLVATLLTVLGFLQLGFRRWFQRETSSLLFWVFLLLGVGLALDHWTFALATRFWTITVQMQSDQARRAYEMSIKLASYFLSSTVAVGVLNIGLALLRRRGS